MGLISTFTIAQNKIFLYNNSAIKDTSQGYYIEYKVPNATTAIIICPGGGYTKVAIEHEGKDVATWFNKLGVDAYVLHYRVTNNTQQFLYPTQVYDINTLYKIISKNYKSLGIMGSSAGGHLAGTAITNGKMKFNFAVLLYPVISTDTTIWHRGSFKALLGDDYRSLANDFFSIDKRINKKTPPILFIHCKDDKTVPYQNSELAFIQSSKFKPQSKLLLYENGKHGFGMRPLKTDAANWTEEMKSWLQAFIQ
jgi:acetyl esterase/lipase